MADEWRPVIITAKFTPNPANVGDSVLVQVKAIDMPPAVEQEELRMTAEFLTGEV